MILNKNIEKKSGLNLERTVNGVMEQNPSKKTRFAHLKRRKGVFGICACLLLVVTSSIFYACKKDKINEVPLLKHKNFSFADSPDQDDPAYWGFIHNLFLANFNEIFDETNADVSDAQTPDEVIDYCNKINLSYLHTLYAEGMIDDVDTWEQIFEETKYYTCTPYLYYVLSASGTSGITYQLKFLKNQGVIDELECLTLNNIMNNVRQNLSGMISHAQFLICINHANTVYMAHYNEDSEHGKMLGIVLGIANASAEYWGKRPDLLEPYPIWDEKPNNVIPCSPCYAVPAVVAADVGGAIVGAVGGAVSSKVTSGEVNGKAVAIGATIGAVSASVGAPAAVGNAVCKAAVQAGKWIAKLF
jgi:hypothetical protein